ncbi:Uncharacterized protein DAT39_018901, partial [Clarias magur]
NSFKEEAITDPVRQDNMNWTWPPLGRTPTTFSLGANLYCSHKFHPPRSIPQSYTMLFLCPL